MSTIRSFDPNQTGDTNFTLRPSNIGKGNMDATKRSTISDEFQSFGNDLDGDGPDEDKSSR